WVFFGQTATSGAAICALMIPRPQATLADLFTLLFAANPFSAARASLWRWSSDEFEDGLAHGGQCRSRRGPIDSFFSALLFLAGGTWGKRRGSSSLEHDGEGPATVRPSSD